MGLIIVFDGIPASGKSTTIEWLRKRLEQENITVGTVDINSGTNARKLKEIADTYEHGAKIRMILFWARRIEQDQKMRQLSKRRDVVLSDRFWGTALAYDGAGSGVPEEVLDWSTRDLLRPDLTFLMSAPLSALRKRDPSPVLSPALHDAEYAERVRQGFETLARKYGWIVVDTSRSEDEVHEYCLGVIRERLNQHKAQAGSNVGTGRGQAAAG